MIDRLWHDVYTVSQPSIHWHTMQRMHGPACGNCASCVHLQRIQCGGHYALKCTLVGTLPVDDTDWRAAWRACGKYEEA